MERLSLRFSIPCLVHGIWKGWSILCNCDSIWLNHSFFYIIKLSHSVRCFLFYFQLPSFHFTFSFYCLLSHYISLHFITPVLYFETILYLHFIAPVSLLWHCCLTPFSLSIFYLNFLIYFLILSFRPNLETFYLYFHTILSHPIFVLLSISGSSLYSFTILSLSIFSL